MLSGTRPGTVFRGISRENWRTVHPCFVVRISAGIFKSWQEKGWQSVLSLGLIMQTANERDD